MRPRTIALVGAAIIAAGLILQHLLMVGASSGVLVRGAQLDQSLLNAVFAVGDTVARVAVPLGSAVIGGGLVLWLAAGRMAPVAAPDSEPASAREPEWVPPTDAR